MDTLRDKRYLEELVGTDRARIHDDIRDYTLGLFPDYATTVAL